MRLLSRPVSAAKRARERRFEPATLGAIRDAQFCALLCEGGPEGRSDDAERVQVRMGGNAQGLPVTCEMRSDPQLHWHSHARLIEDRAPP